MCMSFIHYQCLFNIYGKTVLRTNAAVRKIYSLSANGACVAVSCLDAIEQGTESLLKKTLKNKVDIDIFFCLVTVFLLISPTLVAYRWESFQGSMKN